MPILGRLVVRFRYAVLLVWVAAIAVAIPAARRVGDILRLDIPSAERNESTRARALIDSTFPNPTVKALAVVVSAPRGTDSSLFADFVATVRAAAEGSPVVREVLTPDVPPARDGTSRVVLLAPAKPETAATLTEQLPAFRAALAQAVARQRLRGVADVAVTGEAALEYDAEVVAVNDARRFERWALVPAGLVLIGAFGSLTAAAAPLLMGLAAITGALALLTCIGTWMPVAVYVLPIVSMVGLGVGIDYSLLLVSRFREELGGHDSSDAAAHAVATAGRAVLVSGASVLIGFGALLLTPSLEIRSVGVGGVLVVACAIALATTLLPAVLSIVGTGIDWPRVLAARLAPLRGRGLWKRWGGAITRHRWAALLGGLAVAAALAWPLVRLRVGMPTQGWFPGRMESARAADALGDMGLAGELLPIQVVLRAAPGGRVVDVAHLGALRRLTDSLGDDPRVARVRGPVSLQPGISRLGYALLYGNLALARRRHPDIFESYVAPDGRVALLNLVLADSASMQTGMDVVRDVRGYLRAGVPGLELDDALVGGFIAAQFDTQQELERAFPRMLLLVLGATALMLFLAFRSVVVPLKAVVLNLLSLAGAMGLVVLVFQQGHGASVLGLAAGTGRTFAHVMVLVFAIAFGLSMDYEVFLLTRMKEAFDRSGDNDAATSAGLEATAVLITSAAAIMVVVFGVFAFSRLLIAQVLGFGLAAAVLIDATVVRLVIVPAFMHVAGRWNWWPGRRLAGAENGGNGGQHRRSRR